MSKILLKKYTEQEIPGGDEREAEEGKSSLVAYLLELATMAAIAAESDKEKDLYIAAYTHSRTLDIIRKNDTKKAKLVFGEYCPDWTEKECRFIEKNS